MENYVRWWPGDIVYMRWLKEGDIVRVARVDNGECIALCPTHNTNKFKSETFREVDDPGRRASVSLEDIKDEVFLRLLRGEQINKILIDYEPTPLAEEQNGTNRYSYYYAKKGEEFNKFRVRCFHICDDMQENKERELIKTR